MVDAKTILGSKLSINDAIEALFVPAQESKLGLVRVAAHFNEVEFSGPIVSKLKQMGYMVGFNLMQAGGKPDDVIVNKAKQVNAWGVLDVLYFADSIGNMDKSEVRRIVAALRQEWEGPLGIHTHNNMAKGLDNTLAANSAGVEWLDTTITGMGRGAGNTQTENLLAVLDKQGSDYNSSPIYDLVIRHFESMQKQYGWGSNLLYFLGAQNDVHPTYIQNLLSNAHYGTDEIVGAVKYLSQLDGTTSYNGAVLESALTFSLNDNVISGTNALNNLFNGREVLIIVNSNSTNHYKDAIELYIKTKKPVVVSVNTSRIINNDLIDYTVITHNIKFLSEFESYTKLTKPVILPKHRFSEQELSVITNAEIIDIGFDANASELMVADGIVRSPYDLTSAYVFGLLIEARPKSIGLIGFDGYEKGDSRQQEMLDIINQYNKLSYSAELKALTPTSYPIAQGSIYALYSSI